MYYFGSVSICCQAYTVICLDYFQKFIVVKTLKLYILDTGTIIKENFYI